MAEGEGVAPPGKGEGRGDEQVPAPVGVRLLWSVGALLAVGAVICLFGLLLTDPTDHGWAIGSYVAGLVFAAAAALALGGLAARRRRVVFEAESAVTELRRLQARVEYEDLVRDDERLRLVFQLGKARLYREALLGAEAYAQALELDRALAETEDLLAARRERR